MKDFEKQMLEFYSETENSLEESIRQEQLGTVQKDQALGVLIEKLKNSHPSRKTQSYIEHLQNQVSLIETFFILTDSLR